MTLTKSEIRNPESELAKCGWLVRHPAYVDLLDRLDLTTCDNILSLPEEIVSGHSDRQVSRVQLGDRDNVLSAYLKREHVVPWKERLNNWWAGFGWSSKSWREAQTLALLDQTPIGHPQWIAAGEDGTGRAFVLIRALNEAIPLTECFQRGIDCAQTVGQAVAALHRAGFDQPDLYAGHVFIDPATGDVSFIDWQRTHRCGQLSPLQRCRSLAALFATLPENCPRAEWQRDCLAAYLEDVRKATLATHGVGAQVETIVESLRKRRHIRSKQSLTCTAHSTLFLLDQGRLWLAPAGRRLWPEEVPVAEWLDEQGATNVPLPDGQMGQLTLRCHSLPWWDRRPWTSPERRRMALLFRLERLGIEAPRVLAVGEYPQRDGTMATFLLTRLADGCSSLPSPCPLADRLLEQLDAAGFVLPGGKECLAWQATHARPVVVDVAGLRLRSRGWFARLCSPLRVASL